MGSEYSWHIENRVILARVFGEVTEDDLREGDTAIQQLMAESPAERVHIIFDATGVQRLAITVVQARNKLHYLQDPRLGWIVVFGLHGIMEVTVQFIAGIISRVTGMQLRFVSSMADARLFLKRVDVSLPIADNAT